MPALSLEEWRRAFGINPWFFWGISANTPAGLRQTAQADVVWRNDAWQSDDDAGRNDVVAAIRSAERLLLAYCGYRPGPQYTEATVDWPRLGDTWLSRSAPINARGQWLSVALPEGLLQAVGTEQLTLVGTASMTYSDPDGDGVSELATVTQATSVTDAAQLCLYFQASDRLDGAPLGDAWRIRPVNVRISGGVATITAPAWLFVRPIQYQGIAVQDLNPATAGVLATSVDVVQRTTLTSGTTVDTAQAVVTWETRPCWGWWCCDWPSDPTGGSRFDPAAISQAVCRVATRDARTGLVAPAPALYHSDTGVWTAPDPAVCWAPDRVTVRYLAGVPSPDGQQLAREWQTVVARLAAAELGRPIDAKQPANKELARWQHDRARSAGANDEAYQVASADLDNPFGSRAGHIQAWRYVQRQQLTRGVYAG